MDPAELLWTMHRLRHAALYSSQKWKRTIRNRPNGKIHNRQHEWLSLASSKLRRNAQITSELHINDSARRCLMEAPIMTESLGDVDGAARNRSLLARVLQWPALCLAMQAALTACAPAPFTISPSYGSGPRSEYFDTTMLSALPGEESGKEKYLRHKIVSRGDNETSKLLNIIAEAGGACSRTVAGYACLIDRKYTAQSCDRQGCSTSPWHWQLRVKWPANQVGFTPDVRASILLPKVIRINR